MSQWKDQKKFDELALKWKASTRNNLSSRLSDLTLNNKYYQEIIAMGKDATPLILKELENKLDYWFAALGAIEKIDPVKWRHRGNLTEMRKAWINWGREQGLIK